MTKLKGHKLTLRWSGVSDDYARGSCECGWTFKGWTHRQRDVRFSHGSHLTAVVAASMHDAHVKAFASIEGRARALRIAASVQGAA